MSDDEYFNNDDIFTAEELDNIPLLNQPPSPTIPALDISNAAIVVSHSQAVTSNVPGSSVNNPIVIAEAPSNSPRSPLRTGNREQDQALTTGPASAPAQASGSQRSAPVAVRRESSRLSTIMNALRASQPGQISDQRVGTSGEVFGPPIGLLQTPKQSHCYPNSRKPISPSRVAGPSRQSSQKRTLGSPYAGLKAGLLLPRSSSSSSSNVSDATVRALRAETWSTMEEELTCAICCDIYVAPQITICGHSACAPCLKLWLSKNNNCPICRTYLSARLKPSQNLLAASMVDRLFSEASKHQLPDWCPGGMKRVEWDKRKQAWDREVTQAAAEAARARGIATRSVTAAIQRQYGAQPLFRPENDEYEYEYDEYDDI